MILALAYIILSAKPISMRRLFLLYVFSLGVAYFLLATFHSEHIKLPSQVALVITLAVWSLPLLQALHCAFRGHTGLEQFERVSVCVKATYGFAMVFALAAGASVVIAPFGALSFGGLARMVVVATMGGIGFALVVPAISRNPRQGVTEKVSVQRAYRAVSGNSYLRLKNRPHSCCQILCFPRAASR